MSKHSKTKRSPRSRSSGSSDSSSQSSRASPPPRSRERRRRSRDSRRRRSPAGGDAPASSRHRAERSRSRLSGAQTTRKSGSARAQTSSRPPATSSSVARGSRSGSTIAKTSSRPSSQKSSAKSRSPSGRKRDRAVTPTRSPSPPAGVPAALGGPRPMEFCPSGLEDEVSLGHWDSVSAGRGYRDAEHLSFAPPSSRVGREVGGGPSGSPSSLLGSEMRGQGRATWSSVLSGKSDNAGAQVVVPSQDLVSNPDSGLRFFEARVESSGERIPDNWSAELGVSWASARDSLPLHKGMLKAWPTPANSFLKVATWDPDCDAILKLTSNDTTASAIKAADAALREAHVAAISAMGPWEALRKGLADHEPNGKLEKDFCTRLHAVAAMTGSASNKILGLRRAALLKTIRYLPGDTRRQSAFIDRWTDGTLRRIDGRLQDISLLAGPALLDAVRKEIKSYAEDQKEREEYRRLAGAPGPSAVPRGSAPRGRGSGSQRPPGSKQNAPKRLGQPNKKKKPFPAGPGGRGASRYVPHVACGLFSRGLGGHHSGQVDSRFGSRGTKACVQSWCPSTSEQGFPSKPSSTIPLRSDVQSDKRINRPRSGTSSATLSRTAPVSGLFSRQKDRELQVYSQFKNIEFLSGLPEIQDGKSGHGGRSNVQGRLDGQDRPKKCVLQRTCDRKGQKVPTIHMVRPDLRISADAQWFVPGSEGLYQADEAGNSVHQKSGYQNSMLPRRFVSLSGQQDRSCFTAQASEGAISESRIHTEPGQIVSRTDSDNRIFGVCSRLNVNDGITASKKKGEDCTTMSITPRPGLLHSAGDSQGLGRSTGSRSGNKSGTPTLPETTISKNRSFSTIGRLRDTCPSVCKNQVRPDLVDREPPETGRSSNKSSGLTTYRDLYRQLAVRVRSFLRRRRDTRRLDRRQIRATHKYSRDACSTNCRGIFHEKYSRNVHTVKNRQQDSPGLYKQDGRNKISDLVGSSSTILGISRGQGNSTPGRIYSVGGQCRSRPSVESDHSQERMVTPSQGFQGDHQEVGISRDGSLCESPQRKSPDVHFLEAPAGSLGHGCVENEVAGHGVSVRLPRVQPDRENPQEVGRIQSQETDSNCSSMADPILDAPIIGTPSGEPTELTGLGGSHSGPIRRSPSVAGPSQSESKGLDGFTRQARSEGLSIRATEYLRYRWRTGSSNTYERYWGPWAKWCQERQINPFDPPINIVVDYLVHMFEQGTATSSIGVARSAISAFAVPRDDMPVGQSRRIKELMRAFKNIRPMRARYSVTWSIDSLLQYWNRQPENSQLSLKLLTIKTAVLISISALTRADELNNMLVDNFADRDDQGLAFRLRKPPKNHRDGTVPDVVLEPIKDTPNICPVVCTKEYIHRTGQFRSKEDGIDRTLLFLSIDQRHANVKTGTVSSWIKQGMDLAGIDTSTFKPHSIRGAAVSNAIFKGMTLKQIMKKGRWKTGSVLKRFYVRDLN